MLESVAAGDWEDYSKVCSLEISCFEAESEGHLVEGHAFHRYYFDLASQNPSAPSPVNVTMARPHLRWLSDDAVVGSYTRLTQTCLLYTSPSPRDMRRSRMPSSA